MRTPMTSGKQNNVLPSTVFLLALLAIVFSFSPASLCQEAYFSLYPVWMSRSVNNTRSVVLGDIDGDGDLDLVCGNAGQNMLYLNNDGMLQAEPASLLGPANTTYGIALGDIDGDGDLDLVCGNWAESNTLYLNDGAMFQAEPAWSSGTADSTTSVALGDIDGDGDLDLICGSYGQGNTLYLNDGGIFQAEPAWSSEPGIRTTSVALGDIDGDGDLDLVCGNYLESSTLYLNDGGTFQVDPVWSSGPARGTYGVTLGDIDGDGDLDLVCGNSEQSALYVNDGGMFQVEPAWTARMAINTRSVALGDIDGDGDLDLFCGNYITSGSMLYLNDSGTLQTEPAWTSGLQYATRSIALGDMDADGDLDLVCGNAANTRNTLYLNNAGFFQTSSAWTSLMDMRNNTQRVVLSDSDGDGDLDLVCGNHGHNTLYLNNGGMFQIEPDWSSGLADSTMSVALGDIDGDGDLDLVCGNDDTRECALYLNSGGVGFKNLPAWLSGTALNTKSVALGDIDGDGDLDLVCGNYGHSNTLYLNKGGIFQVEPAWSSGTALNTRSVALGDIDGDGDLDLVCGNIGQSNTLYLNDGGMFQTEPVWSSGPTLNTMSIALGDIDGDGDLDLVCGDTDQITLYFNTGGIFQTEPAWSIWGISNRSVALGDIDGDGDLDLVCGNAATTRNTLYLNEGGIFQTEPALLSGGAYCIDLGDMDEDGDLDLVCGGWGFNWLYLGVKAPAFKGNLLSPRNQLPNNGACLRHVTVEPSGPEYRRVSFTARDVESDPVWLVAEYQHEGDPTWHAAVIGGIAGKVGPFATSPAGVRDSVEWDTHLQPFDTRGLILRLRVIEIPKRVSIIQHAAPYLKEIGPVTPYRQLISVTDVLSFPSVTVGDTTSVTLQAANRGTAPLTITGIDLPTGDMYLRNAFPIQIAPNGSVDLAILLAPSSDADISGSLVIQSDDPFSPSTVVAVTADVRPLDFTLANLYPLGEISQNTALNISVTMQDSVRVDSTRVFFREGGRTSYSAMRLERIDDPVNEQYYGWVPGESITARGIEYFIEIHNDRFDRIGGLRRLRTRVKNLEFGVTPQANQYAMISLPLEMEGPILGVLSDDLGSPDITNWRMWGYDRSADPEVTGAYVELPNDTITHFDLGRGYWLITRGGQTIDTAPAEGLSTPADSAFEIQLEPGWNMIGDPFCFPVAWDSTLVNGMKMAQAESILVEPPVAYVMGRGYRLGVEILEPFVGYWVKNLSDAEVMLDVPPREAQQSGVLAAPREVCDVDGAQSSPREGWRIGIGASSCGIEDMSNFCGIAEGASESWDKNDRSEPPPAPGRALLLYFPHQSWEKNGDTYAVDIRGAYSALPAAELKLAQSGGVFWGHIWRFDVAKSFSAEGVGDEVVLEFAGREDVPAEASVYLIDRELQSLIDVRKESRYSFHLGERLPVSEAEARFALIVGSQDFVDESIDELPGPPERTVLHQNYPNPFNPSTIIRYDLARACSVNLTIYNASGALVRVLYRGYRPAGCYEEAWNGRNEKGYRVSSGIYLSRLETSDGLKQTRKLILMR